MPGQRDRHRRVAGGVEGVQLDQPGQPALPGALGVRGAAGLAERAAARPVAAPPAPRSRPDPAGPAGAAAGRPRAGRRGRRRHGAAPRRRCARGRRLGVVRGMPPSLPTDGGGCGSARRDNSRGHEGESRSVMTAARPPKADAVGVGAVDAPATALLELVDAGDVGEHLGHASEGERVVTHFFACTRRATAAGAGRSPWPGRPGRRRSPSTRSCCCPATRRSSPPSGCRGATGSSPATSAPATCCRPRTDDPRLVPGVHRRRRRPVDEATPSRRSPTSSASAGPGALARGPRPRRAAVVRRLATAPRPRSPSRLPASAARAASWSGWPGRCRPCSASAPTPTPTTTAGWSPSTTAAARTPRRSSSKKNLPQPLPEPVLDTLTWDDLEQF